MRVIAHISDLHFGRDDPQVTEMLIADLRAQRPDLVAVSGDLTQRARPREFAAAREFLDRLAVPTVAVPGNHDVPLYDLARRAFRPLARFRRAIAPPHPLYSDRELAVLGVSTAQAGVFTGGRIARRDLAAIRRSFAPLPEATLRALVMHHPLMAPPDAPGQSILSHAEHALAAIAEAGIALLLTGHYHRSFSAPLATCRIWPRSTILVSQAGTATSTRRRDEANSYNLLAIDGQRISCTRRAFDGHGFAARERQDHALPGAADAPGPMVR